MPSKAPPKPTKAKPTKKKASTAPSSAKPIPEQVAEVLAWLRKNSSKSTREGMARYGIPSTNALGVTMANMRLLGKRLGRNHELALALWDSEAYEARMVSSFVADPALLSPRLSSLPGATH